MNSKYTISTAVLLIVAFWFSELLGAQYFPKELDMPATEKRIDLPYYSAVFESLKEPALWPLAKDPNVISYRFTYLVSRGHGPVVLRLDHIAGRRWVLTVKLGDVSASGKPKFAVNRKRSLAEDEVEQFHDTFDALDFWQLPTVGALEAEVILGGTFCILEAVENGRYHLVERRSPKNSDEHWVSDPHVAKQFQKLREEEGYPYIDRATSAETNRKLVAVGQFLMRLSGLKIQVY